jgi:DNA-binding transcriptional LysR family regulator
MIDYRYLDAFVAVCEEGNFTKAGYKLGIATSAVSRQIRMLEDSGHIQLLFRSPQKVSLTNAGKALLESAKQFSSEVEEILGNDSVKKLRIGTLEGIHQHWLTKIILTEPLFQGIDLEISVGMPSKIIAQLGRNELDVCFFSFVHNTPTPEGLCVYRLFREEIVLISKRKISLSHLHDHPWICFSSGTWIMKYTTKRPPKLTIVNSMRSVVDYVREGAGIAMVPSYLVAGYDDLVQTPIEKFSGAHICMALHEYKFPPKIIKGLLECVRSKSPAWKRLQ